jgi:hypothetical protein
MSKFTDALNSPLPSKVNAEQPVVESTEIDDATATEDMDMSTDVAAPGPENEGADINDAETEGCEGKSCEGSDVDMDDLDDFDPDDMSEDELAALDAELSDGALDSVIGDDDEEVNLSPEEEIEADDMMSVAATTLLVNDELNAEEKAAFVENEGETAVREGFMTETDVNEIALESGLVQEAKYNQKMIIRLDAESKKKQLYALAVNVSAAAHGDQDFVRLKKVMKMRKILRAKLERKYHAEATKRMKIYFNRLRHSKSNALSKIGDKYSK